ncbi:Histone acetyltransferase KAT7 [Halotydeus destructor]|nr:Histone acetyltransferase KAT7 [Halotydeus destructor]
MGRTSSKVAVRGRKKAEVKPKTSPKSTPTKRQPETDKSERLTRRNKRIKSKDDTTTVAPPVNPVESEDEQDTKADLSRVKEEIVEKDVGDKCSVPGCDSRGHLSGKYEFHQTPITCPVFHNLTSEDCEDRYQRRLKRRLEGSPKKSPGKQTARKSPKWKEERLMQLNEARKKDAQSILTNSPRGKSYSINRANSSREPDLRDLVPIFDLDMFREAQSRAAQLVQEQLEADKMAIQKNNATTSYLKSVQLGKYVIDVWYASPYPEEYLCLPKLYICEFCLKYFNSPLIMRRHSAKCTSRFPPGDEIYRKGNLSVFEVDGDKNKTYCQNLCLLAKMFLDHKTLYYDVEPFLFYIMTEANSDGFHIVGYFSKEKNSFLNYNVSCILTLPPYQKQGFGRILIDFSYLLTRTEGKTGSPEKPLSDLGLISYRSYWKNVILEKLCHYEGSEISIRDLSQETAINAYDIVSTLQSLGMLKYWKGKHLVLTKKEVLEDFRTKTKKKKCLKRIDPSSLHWTPPQNTGQH